MRYNKILVDIYNFYYRAFHGAKNIVTRNKVGTILETGGILTAILMVKNLRKKYLVPGGKIYFLVDSYHADDSEYLSRRKLIDPEYKEDREIASPEFYRGLDLLQLVLKNYADNFFLIKIHGLEADDIVNPLVKEFSLTDYILMVSTDLDWASNITDKVHWLRDRETLLDRRDFIKEYDFPPNGVFMYKSFRGDTTDNIPKGVPNISEKILKKLVNEGFKSISELFLSLDTLDYVPDQWKTRIKENKGRLFLNHDLVTPYEIPRDPEIENYLVRSRFEPQVLKKLYDKLGVSCFDADERFVDIEGKPENLMRSQKTERC